ncbi:MAG TPA: COX15/CtaA family protein [Bryobacteraceae bacterium]|nr:COX15/CtaA family protein [Bryobacteraceae bacterium]
MGAIAKAAPAGSAERTFSAAAWAVLGWNFLVVLWGAFVRASGSGAGCGGHWPLCNGAVVPQSPQAATVIEYTHRVTSGVALVAVFALAFAARRVFPKGHAARRAAAFGAVFIVTEALLGAGLVLFDYVAHNASAGRAAYLSLHLANTQLLLASLAIAAWCAARGQASLRRPAALAISTLAVVLSVSITGAIAALGDTLFPAASLATGVRQDFSATANFLVRLRVIHPALAVAAAAFVLYAALGSRRSGASQRAVLWVIVLVFAQVCAGAVNIALLAPVWMQILHLLMADLLWVALLILVLETGGNNTLEPEVLRSRVA